MGRFEAFSMGDVSHESLAELAGHLGHDLSWFSHSCGSVSLAKVMLGVGLKATSLSTLIDGLVYTDPTLHHQLNVSEYPDIRILEKDGLGSYGLANAHWTNQVRGVRFAVQQDANHSFRRYMRVAGVDINEFRMLESSGQMLMRSLQALMSGGIKPEHINSENRVVHRAKEIWESLLDEVADFDAVSRSLWIDPREFRESKTEHSREVGQRLRQLLVKSFGDGPWAIMHHGFYFYTAPMWAMFQLLRQCDDVDQYFVVHDDGHNPVFGTWRQFFGGSWDMPIPTSFGVEDRCSTNSEEFRRALNGLSVREDNLRDRLEIEEFRNATELMIFLRSSQESILAADADSMNRISKAFGSARSIDKMPLAQLPIGVFLRTLHRTVSSVGANSVRIDLSPDRFMDIVSSGFVDIPGVNWQDPRTVEAIRVTMPYFMNCRSVIEWRANADALRRLVLGPSTVFGERSVHNTLSDGIKATLGNPLLTVPWMDITADEVDIVHRTVEVVTTRLAQLATPQSKRIREHLKLIGAELDKGLSVLNPEEQTRVRDRLKWATNSDDFEPFVEDLADMVDLLTGHRIAFDVNGEPEETDELIGELRNLSALSFAESPTSLHLTNLSDASFPIALSSDRWPFSMAEIVVDKSSREEISREIMECRATNAMASDLYLFWLALNGVRGENKLRLSYVSHLEGDITNLSPFVKLLAAPEWNGAEAVGLVIGGFEIKNSTSAEVEDLLGRRVQPSSDDSLDDVGKALAVLPRLALASALYCPRRTALQWIVGSSASFQSVHQWQILMANVRGLLYRALGSDESVFRSIWPTSRDLVQAVWRNLGPSSWQSSYANRRLKARGPDSAWILTLGGNNGSGHNKPNDLAYQLAITGDSPSAEEFIGLGTGFVPDRLDTTTDICSMCPVRNRCAVWENREEAKED